MTLPGCAGQYLDWTDVAVDDAFCYAERRLGGTGELARADPPNPSSIEPKNTTGMLRPDMHPLQAQYHKKVYTGIQWREVDAA